MSNWDEIVKVAQKIAVEYNIPLSVLLAQAAHESNYGNQAPGNNLFGIKGSGTAGTQLLRTKEAGPNGELYDTTANFAAYKSPEDSLRAYAELITTNPTYANALQYRDDPERFLIEIKNAGYATDPNYINAVLPLVREFQAYDKTTPTTKAPTSVAQRVLSAVVKPAYAEESTSKPYSQPYSQSYTVKRGDTLWDIAQKKLGSGNRWKELMGYSGDPRKLPIGTTLTVPSPARSYNPPLATPAYNASTARGPIYVPTPSYAMPRPTPTPTPIRASIAPKPTPTPASKQTVAPFNLQQTIMNLLGGARSSLGL